MENNFNESMNLGNIATNEYANTNQESPVAPVFQTSTTGTNENITVNIPSQPIGVSQQMHSQVVGNISTTNLNDVTVATSTLVPPTPPVDNTSNQETPKVNEVRNEARVPVVILKNLVSNAKKVGTYDVIRTISQVVRIELGTFGIKVNASNGKIDYECIDDNIKYNVSLTATVDINDLSEFLGYCDFEEIMLSIVDGNLLVTTPTGGTAQFAERVDLSTQQPIELNLTFPIKYDDLIEIDYEKMVYNINQSKPVRDIQKLDEEFSGTLFSNLVLASDRSIIFIQDNQPILKSQKFFIGTELCNVITSLNFNKAKFRIGFTTDSNNDIRAITLSDGKLTICGNVEPVSGINEEVCNNFWNSQFANSITIPTKKLINALKRIGIFMKLDKNKCNTFEFSSNSVKIIPESSSAKEIIMLESNPTNYAGTVQIPKERLESILNSIKSDTITFAIDNEDNGVIGVVADEYKWIIGLMDE